MKGTKATINDIAKHAVGAVLYRVVFRPVGLANITIPPGDEWMAEAHPKVLFERGIATKTWRHRRALPKLCAIDFQNVVELLTSEPIVERFTITTIYRSTDTGEFYYANSDGDWMPESYLMLTAADAKREKLRLKNLFKVWSEQLSPDESS